MSANNSRANHSAQCRLASRDVPMRGGLGRPVSTPFEAVGACAANDSLLIQCAVGGTLVELHRAPASRTEALTGFTFFSPSEYS
jgi:hypothetical protein